MSWDSQLPSNGWPFTQATLWGSMAGVNLLQSSWCQGKYAVIRWFLRTTVAIIRCWAIGCIFVGSWLLVSSSYHLWLVIWWQLLSRFWRVDCWLLSRSLLLLFDCCCFWSCCFCFCSLNSLSLVVIKICSYQVIILGYQWLLLVIEIVSCLYFVPGCLWLLVLGCLHREATTVDYYFLS